MTEFEDLAAEAEVALYSQQGGAFIELDGRVVGQWAT